MIGRIAPQLAPSQLADNIWQYQHHAVKLISISLTECVDHSLVHG